MKMGHVEQQIGELEPASERARKALQQKITKQKTKRYYRTAHSLNFGESRHLNAQLNTISNAEHEYKRAFSANQKMFKINRRRHIESLEHVKVGHEIKTLQEKRRQSTVLYKLTITQDIENAAKKMTNPKETISLEAISDTPLPATATAALHEGLPTILSRPKIIKRIKTAPAYGRRHSNIQSQPSVVVSDPLRMLERVETSDGFIGVRDRLARKASAIPMSNHTRQKIHEDFPDYLALDPLEAIHIRANVKQLAVNRCKSHHAGSNERCTALVKNWLQDFKQA